MELSESSAQRKFFYSIFWAVVSSAGSALKALVILISASPDGFPGINPDH